MSLLIFKLASRGLRISVRTSQRAQCIPILKEEKRSMKHEKIVGKGKTF